MHNAKCHNGVSDASLVRSCVGGDNLAWAELLRRFGPLIYAIARRFRLSEEDCVDVYGQVCKTLLENLDKLRCAEGLPGYVAKTTQRACLAVLRGYQRRQRIARLSSLNPGLDSFSTSDELIRGAMRGFAVRRALENLDERCHKLLWLLFFDERQLGYREISRMMHLPVASIGPTRSRCLDKFRKVLKRMGFDA